MRNKHQLASLLAAWFVCGCSKPQVIVRTADCPRVAPPSQHPPVVEVTAVTMGEPVVLARYKAPYPREPDTIEFIGCGIADGPDVLAFTRRTMLRFRAETGALVETMPSPFSGECSTLIRVGGVLATMVEEFEVGWSTTLVVFDPRGQVLAERSFHPPTRPSPENVGPMSFAAAGDWIIYGRNVYDPYLFTFNVRTMTDGPPLGIVNDLGVQSMVRRGDDIFVYHGHGFSSRVELWPEPHLVAEKTKLANMERHATEAYGWGLHDGHEVEVEPGRFWISAKQAELHSGWPPRDEYVIQDRDGDHVSARALATPYKEGEFFTSHLVPWGDDVIDLRESLEEVIVVRIPLVRTREAVP